jgi:hypothetical protein
MGSLTEFVEIYRRVGPVAHHFIDFIRGHSDPEQEPESSADSDEILARLSNPKPIQLKGLRY